MRTDEFARHSIQETLKTLDVDPLRGLSTPQVVERRKRFGNNEIIKQVRITFERMQSYSLFRIAGYEA